MELGYTDAGMSWPKLLMIVLPSMEVSLTSSDLRDGHADLLTISQRRYFSFRSNIIFPSRDSDLLYINSKVVYIDMDHRNLSI